MPSLTTFTARSQQGTTKINGPLPVSYMFMQSLATLAVPGNQ